jgi:hypothetical protein
MDKGRHPHVVRTWTVERLRVPIRTPQPPKLRVDPRQEHFHAPEIKPRVAAPPPKKTEE